MLPKHIGTQHILDIKNLRAQKEIENLMKNHLPHMKNREKTKQKRKKMEKKCFPIN